MVSSRSPSRRRPNRRVRDVLAERTIDAFVGRRHELAVLLGALEQGGPLVTHLHGIAGIGKSSLLEIFAARARARRATVVRIDCRAVEPTARGFLHELGAAIGGEPATPARAASRLTRLGRRVILVLDNYEVFRLLDTWLRQSFVPALGDNVRMLLAGREPAIGAWYGAPGWAGLFHSLELGPLDQSEASILLRGLGVTERVARRINGFARGHPLALVLAASAAEERPDLDFDEAAVPRVVDALTRSYLADVEDPVTRETLGAAAVTRRMTLPLLRAMLPGAAPQDAFERLRALPFVESGRDGLIVHDAVKQAIAATLKASDPGRYRALRRAAWRHLGTAARRTGGPALWRYTADILYLLENPAVREAFFPSGVHHYVVEPSRAEDSEAILGIARMHEARDGAKALEAWWAALPACFHVVRGPEGKVDGFYVMSDSAEVPQALLRADPVVRSWVDYLRKDPPLPGERVLFLRRWLSAEQGEAPSPAQGACWLDIKRHYMELRPHVRRITLTLRDLAPYAVVAARLGFRPNPDADAEIDAAVHHSAVLDFGPDSVDGWLAGLVAAELGTEDELRLDAEEREVVLEDRRVALTPREFAVMRSLWEHHGRVVTRDELLDAVWEPGYDGGSNVVDVVVRALRRKLGEQASVLQTVHRGGYRLRV